MIATQLNLTQDLKSLQPYLLEHTQFEPSDYDIPTISIPHWTPGMIANRDFLNQIDWAEQYFREEHISHTLRQRHLTALQTTLDNKIVIDIGCGPGNHLRTLGGNPKTIIGIDISHIALQMASKLGYTPLLADVHHIPLKSHIADIVIANATLHHCDNMAQVLAEAARLVRPGGLLLTDKDPQVSAWKLKGLGYYLHQAKYSHIFPLYRHLQGRPLASWTMQMARYHGEIHNRQPGDGITKELYHQVLTPLGFDIQLFPHNHTLGSEVLQGQWGKSPNIVRYAQKLSGLDPDAITSAQSILCIAKRTNL
jgi:ubiquinone/menaquinone biosynthesis C-methylase UbiE